MVRLWLHVKHLMEIQSEGLCQQEIQSKQQSNIKIKRNQHLQQFLRSSSFIFQGFQIFSKFFISFSIAIIRFYLVFQFIIYSKKMRKQGQEQTKLIVIHEYSPSDLKTFMSPTLKKSLDSLPKVYGRKGKRRYLHNIQDIISCENITFQRQCCHLLYSEKHRSTTEVEIRQRSHIDLEIMAKPKKESCGKGTCICSRSLDSKMKVKERKEIQKNVDFRRYNKMKLPHLKQFGGHEFIESESHHKIFQEKHPVAHFSNSKEKEAHFGLISLVNKSKNAHSNISAKDEESQTEPRHFSSKGKETSDMNNKHASPGSIKSFQSSFKVKRVESEPLSQEKFNQERHNKSQYESKTKAKLFSSSNFAKDMKIQTKSEDQSYSISSFTMKNQTSNTVFQQIKKMSLKESSKNYRPNSKNKAYSILSNGLFKIPEQDEYEDYLKFYRPLNPTFNINELIKQQNFHIVPTENHVYFGQIVNRQKNGKGVTVSQKEIYEGTYENNVKTSGSEKNRDGKYTGQFLRGKRSGHGKFQWINGEIFEGEWEEGKKNGFGTWKSPKGDYYEGYWKDNRQNGKGIYVHKGGSKYKGYFKQFLKHGKGEQEFANGDKYGGDYELGKPHGFGKYTWANGDTYQGEFVDGSRVGKGKLKRVSGEYYDGEFKHDLKHGLGMEKYKSGQIFEGEFKHGERFKGKLRTKHGAQILITAN